MKSRFIFLIFAFLYFQTNLSVNAQPGCSHYSPESILERFEVVFAGKVLGYADENGRKLLNVKVSENFRGAESQKTFEILPANDGCVGKRNVGETYLFAIGKNPVSGLWNSYSFSGEYQSNVKQRQFIEYLRWKKSNPTDSLIVGKVLTQNFGNLIEKSKPSNVTKIFLQSESGKISETLIEPDGFYKFKNVMPGKYSVFLKLPAGLSFVNPNTPEKRTLTVDAAKGVILYFDLVFNNFISGKVANSKNAPLKSIFAVLYFVDNAGRETMVSKAETDESGAFRFEKLMPGSYIIETFPVKSTGENFIPKISYLDINSEFPTTYFPNARNKNEAVKIRLKAGENLTEANIRLESLPRRTIKGRVLYSDGTPAQDAEILVKIKRTANEKFMQPVNRFEQITKTDSNGSFSFHAYSDTKYKVQAVLRKSVQGITRLYNSDCVDLPETGEIPPLEFFFARRTFLRNNAGCSETNSFY